MGSARARDDGWMHIDATGRPLYRRRFAALEPFYNGQARVERFDGTLEVMDEAGRRLVVLGPALKAISPRLLRTWAELRLAAEVDRTWHTTGGGGYLEAAHPWTLAGALECSRFFPRLWEALPQALRGTHWHPPGIFA